MRAAIFIAFSLVIGCGNAEEKKKEAQARQKAFMEAEAKARVEAEAKEAKEAIDKASAGCSGGDAAACIDLGKIHFDGKGVDRDTKKAIEHYAKACALKSQEGCRLAAQHESDNKKKFQYLSTLCDLKDPNACFEAAPLAETLVKDGQLKDAKKLADTHAMKFMKLSCGYGGALACTVRGKALLNDDVKQAADSLAKGCDLNEPTSCIMLADLYATGKGVKKKDAKKAGELKKKACDGGLKDAC